MDVFIFLGALFALFVFYRVDFCACFINHVDSKEGGATIFWPCFTGHDSRNSSEPMNGIGYTPPPQYPPPDAILIPEGQIVEFLSNEQLAQHNWAIDQFGWPATMRYGVSMATGKPMLAVVCKRCGIGKGILILYRDTEHELRLIENYYRGVQGTK